MSQSLFFPAVSHPGKAMHVKIEPGDNTMYRFVIMLMGVWWGEGWEQGSRPLVAIASDQGPLFPGIILPLARVLDWWRDTYLDENNGLDHEFIRWIREQNDSRVRGGTNPWTVRAALLAILRFCGDEIRQQVDPKYVDDQFEQGGPYGT